MYCVSGPVYTVTFVGQFSQELDSECGRSPGKSPQLIPERNTGSEIEPRMQWSGDGVRERSVSAPSGTSVAGKVLTSHSKHREVAFVFCDTLKSLDVSCHSGGDKIWND